MGFHSHNLLEDGYDIRTIQELRGHKEMATTMICTHVLKLAAKASGVRRTGKPGDADRDPARHAHFTEHPIQFHLRSTAPSSEG